MNLPHYNFISAPLFLINILHIVTLTFHFVAMNFMLGGIIIVLWGKFTDRWQHPTVQKFVGLFPSAMAATISLGVAPLLFLQLVYHKQVYSAAIVSGWFWLMIIPVLILAYYCLYSASFAQKRKTLYQHVRLLVALLAIGYVSFIYSSVFSMAERPDLIKSLYMANQSGLLINPHIADYIFRWLHMIFGAITVGAFFIGLLGQNNEQAFKVGKIFFLGGMMVAAIFGIFYLFNLGSILPVLVKSPSFHFMMLGVVLSIGSLHFFFKKKFFISGSMLFISLVSMVTTRHTVRLLQLADYYEPSSLQVSPQWSIFFLFVISLIFALGVIGYMVRLYMKDRRI